MVDWLGVYTLRRNICGGVSFQHIYKWQIGWEFINSQETFAVESVFSVFMNGRLVGIFLQSQEMFVVDSVFSLFMSGRLVGSFIHS